MRFDLLVADNERRRNRSVSVAGQVGAPDVPLWRRFEQRLELFAYRVPTNGVVDARPTTTRFSSTVATFRMPSPRRSPAAHKRAPGAQ